MTPFLLYVVMKRPGADNNWRTCRVSWKEYSCCALKSERLLITSDSESIKTRSSQSFSKNFQGPLDIGEQKHWRCFLLFSSRCAKYPNIFGGEDSWLVAVVVLTVLMPSLSPTSLVFENCCRIILWCQFIFLVFRFCKVGLKIKFFAA